MRDPDAITEKRIEAAIADAVRLLRPLAPLWPRGLSWTVVSWNEPDASDSRDLFEAAVEFVIALLDPATPTSSARAKTYDPQAQQAADEFLGVHASIVRKVVLPALRLGRPPERKGPRRGGKLLRDRWIAAVVVTVCQRHKLHPYRNPLSEPHSGCAIVAEALKRLGIELVESSVEEIYRKHKA